MQLAFQIDGEPIAQPRPKVSTRGGYARAYVDAKHPVHAYKQAVALAAKAALGRSEPAIGPVRVTMQFVMPRPKGLTWKTKATPRRPDIRKPDWENCAKAVCDAMEGVLYRNDSQIVSACVEKIMAAGGESPCTKVFVEWEV